MPLGDLPVTFTRSGGPYALSLFRYNREATPPTFDLVARRGGLAGPNIAQVFNNLPAGYYVSRLDTEPLDGRPGTVSFQQHTPGFTGKEQNNGIYSLQPFGNVAWAI